MSTPDAAPLARCINITKRFGRVTVLQDVNFDIRPGEVHILAGENGAGKSTLVKIIGGVYADFEGQLEVGGEPRRFNSPLDAAAAGIAVIYQELSLIGSMTVSENIFLGRNLTGPGGFVRQSEQRDRARSLLDRLGLAIDVDHLVEDLPIAQQQLVEIAKALVQDARVIIMDEPTSSLSAPEVSRLFELIADLKGRGCGIVYISHKMEEIERIADRITVLRDGEFIGTAPAAELPFPKLINWMVGRPMQERFPRHAPHASGTRLQVKNFSVAVGAKTVLQNLSFSVGRGEILGIAGLQGSGASELLLGLFGAYGARAVAGEIELDGEALRVRSPADAIRSGVALLTNDRKATGLVLSLSILANTTLAALAEVCPGGWRSDRRERQMTEPLSRALALRAASLAMETAALSGGNQQKVAIAKWLATEPRVLLLDEPTRGIDIGAKRDIYRLMDEWTAQGKSIVLITSELPELLSMSDRILVLHRGARAAEYLRAEATPQRVLEAAMGRAMVGSAITPG